MRAAGACAATGIAFASLALHGCGDAGDTKVHANVTDDTPAYYHLEKGTCCCPKEDALASMEDCHNALHYIAEALGFNSSDAENVSWNGTSDEIPPACSFKEWPSMKTGRGHWNRAETGSARHNMISVCHNSSKAKNLTGKNKTVHANLTNYTHAEDVPEPTAALEYYKLVQGTCCCPKEDELESMEHCHQALHFISGEIGFTGAEAEDIRWNGTSDEIPPACSFKVWPSMKTGRGHWNRDAKGSARDDMIPVCHNSTMAAAHVERLFDVSIHGLQGSSSGSLFVALSGGMLVSAVGLVVVMRRRARSSQPEDAASLIPVDEEDA